METLLGRNFESKDSLRLDYSVKAGKAETHAREPLIWRVVLVLAAETALPGRAGRFSAVRKPQMRVFGAKPPPVQPPQGRSGKFRTRFSLVTTGAAGQSSGSRSPEAAQAAARSSPDPDTEPCRIRTPARDPERMLHPRLRRLRLGRSAARRQSGLAPSRRAEADSKASGRDAGGRSLRMVHQPRGAETAAVLPRKRVSGTSGPWETDWHSREGQFPQPKPKKNSPNQRFPRR